MMTENDWSVLFLIFPVTIGKHSVTHTQFSSPYTDEAFPIDMNMEFNASNLACYSKMGAWEFDYIIFKTYILQIGILNPVEFSRLPNGYSDI